MKIIFFLFCMVFFLSTTFTQSPQDFNSLTFSESSNTVSLIYKLASNGNDLYFLKSNSTDNQYFSIIKTNSDFRIQHKIDTLKFRGEIVTSIPFFEMENNQLLILAKSKNSDFYYFYSYDENLSNITIIDSLYTKQQSFRAVNFKRDSQNGRYYTFGRLTNVVNSKRQSVYLEISKGGIQNFQQLDKYYGIIQSFSILPDSLGYLLSSFDSSTTYFLDIDFKEIDSRKNRFQYIENNITYNGILGPKYYFNQDDKILCFGRKFENSSYSLNLIETDVSGDSIDWINVIPLFDNSSDTNDFVELIHTNDTFGNHFLVFQSVAYPWDDTITSNVIYVYKFDEDLNIVWNVKLQNENEHLITAINVLDNNDIILAGILNDNFQYPNNNKDFHLKIGSDGLLITKNNDIKDDIDFKVYPNPCNNYINVYLATQDKYSYKIFSIQGQKLKEGVLENQISTERLLQGVYILQIISSNGSVYNKKIIKK